MQKNKTHRIVSISPSSQQLYLKQNNNKTTTPVKPFQQQTQNTRTNTIKTTARPQVSLGIDETNTKSQNKHDNIESIYVSSYKNEGFQKNYDIAKFKKQPKVDDILHRIGREYDDDLNNSASNQLLKKTEISQLRQVIRSSKYLLKSRQEANQDPLKNVYQTKLFIQETSLSIKQQLFTFFSDLHQQLKNQQKQLYRQLQEKVYFLNEKYVTKCLQESVLQNLVQKCEADINKNYEQIIKNLEMSKLSQICKSYTQKLQFHMQMIRTQYKLKLDLPEITTILSTLQNVNVAIQESDEYSSKLLSNNCELKQWNRDQVTKKQKQIHATRQSLGRHIKNTKSDLEDLQNIPFGKIKMKQMSKLKQMQPRVSSARGRY